MSIAVTTQIACDICATPGPQVLTEDRADASEVRRVAAEHGWTRANLAPRPGLVRWSDLCPTCSENQQPA
jgi:hypothetical protein